MYAVSNGSILVAIITITVLFFLFSVFIVIYFLTFRKNQKRYRENLLQFQKEFERQKLQSQVELQELTYKHIAKELHDNIGQLMGTTKMLISVVEKQSGDQNPILTEADHTLGKAIHEIRHLSRSLDNEWLEQFELCENLKEEKKRIMASGNVVLAMECPERLELDKSSQIILYRVIQEGIQNALKHASPSLINVCVKDGQPLSIHIVNDGKALPEMFSGMGTNNMRKRVEVLGGSIDWSSEDQLTHVRIMIPQINP